MRTELFTKGCDERNEDYCKVVESKGITIAILADGMGGLSLGREAAECVCNTLAEYLLGHLGTEGLWQNAYTCADNKLQELSLANHSNMGAAVTALIANDSWLEVAWQGNVRLYIGKGDLREQVTSDHVIDSGYGQKMLTRCLRGGGLRGEVPTLKRAMSGEEILFLCTDGYYNNDDNDDSTCLTLFPDAHRQ